MPIPSSILDLVHVKIGDITVEAVDAIVNAANPSLLGGGGVDGAIHRAAGPGLLKECIAIGGCSPGEARITGGHNLKAKFIIHTPGPVYKNGNQGEDALLKNSYWNSLLLAKKYGIHSLSFPAISTGVYGYPKVEACSIAIDTVCEFMDRQEYHLNVYFILFDNESYDLYNNYAATLRAKAL